jgi:hypothetical protein
MLLLPFVVTVRRIWATWAAPAKPIWSGAVRDLMVRMTRRPWLTRAVLRAGTSFQGRAFSCRCAVAVLPLTVNTWSPPAVVIAVEVSLWVCMASYADLLVMPMSVASLLVGCHVEVGGLDMVRVGAGDDEHEFIADRCPADQSWQGSCIARARHMGNRAERRRSGDALYFPLEGGNYGTLVNEASTYKFGPVGEAVHDRHVIGGRANSGVDDCCHVDPGCGEEGRFQVVSASPVR